MSTIQNTRAVNNPQQSFEWEFEIIGSVAGGDFELLRERVQNASIPEKTVETYEINYKSGKTTHAGRDGSSKTFTVTFWEDETNGVRRYFDNWIENGILNSTIGGGLTRDLYQAQGRIRMKARDSQADTLKVLHTNVFPTSIGETSLSYDGSEVKTVDVTFSFDRQIIE